MYRSPLYTHEKTEKCMEKYPQLEKKSSVLERIKIDCPILRFKSIYRKIFPRRKIKFIEGEKM